MYMTKYPCVYMRGGTSKAVLAIRSSLNLYNLQSSVMIGLHKCVILLF